LLLAHVGTPALAQSPEELRAPRATVSVTLGGAARNLTLGGGADENPLDRPLTIGGVSSMLYRLRADFYVLPWLGLDVDGTFDTFSSEAGDAPKLSHLRLDVRALVALRYAFPKVGLLGGGLGYGHTRSPFRTYVLTQAMQSYSPVTGEFVTHSLAARVFGSLFIDRFEATLDVTLVPRLGSGTTTIEPRLLAGVKVLDLDTFALSVVAEYSALFDVSETYSGQFHRFSGGLRVAFRSARAESPIGTSPQSQDPSVRVVAKMKAGAAAAATVSLDGRADESLDAEGARVWSTTAGEHRVQVKLPGHRTVTRTVLARAGEATLVEVTLEALTGPGALSGVVLSAATKQPVSGATVTVGTRSVQSNGSGQYAFASAGPGPVTVRVEAQGFTTAEEVVQVPPEQASTLDVALEKLGKGSPATVRGLVRSEQGEPLKASVVIKGVATKVTVNGEGRFVVTIPGGDYLFVISAPGYVAQTKKVTLADGDQAIFHCELQKAGK
jgi:hypothetical protein